MTSVSTIDLERLIANAFGGVETRDDAGRPLCDAAPGLSPADLDGIGLQAARLPRKEALSALQSALAAPQLDATARRSLAGLRDRLAAAPVTATAPAAAGLPHRVNYLVGALTARDTERLMMRELAKPLVRGGAAGPAVQAVQMPTVAPNPFHVAKEGFAVDRFLVRPGEEHSPPPRITAADAAWFGEQVRAGKAPQVLQISGHHVNGEGAHDHAETKFIFWPTLRDAIETYPEVRAYFAEVKLVMLWGCNTMTNLEPHEKDGSFMAPHEIEHLYRSGAAGRTAVLGDGKDPNTLEGYRARLAREYGPSSPTGHYEYTRGPKAEKCTGPFDACQIEDLDRIMPDAGLFDGTHRFNMPAVAKELFPNALLVLGYSSPSPSEDVRARIFAEVLRRAYVDLAARQVNNVFVTMMDPATPESLRLEIVETLRRHWTLVTTQMNRGRPSGSVTPALPQLDRNGIFNVQGATATPGYRPYEKR